jgi:ribulose-phosphate 3-epimerase
MALIAPSLLAADFLRLAEECDMVNKSEADRLHLDVMDGRFVPNISFGLPVIEQVNKINSKRSEVHLMIMEPEKYAEAFKKAGAETLIVHQEACMNLHRNIQQIHSLGMKAGVAINPHTPVFMLADILAEIDLVCLMSVNPGFGGQQFILHTLEKIKELKALMYEKGTSVEIEIDGGVTVDNAQSIIQAGADVLVAGSTVFGSAEPLKIISRLTAIR